jgi:hypothetical protein
MPTSECRNQANLRLVRIERTDEELLELEFREDIVALVVPKGRRPRRFNKVAKGELHPMRIPGRLVRDAIDARVPSHEIARVMCRAIKRYVARKARQPLQDTGEFRPAA